MSQPSLSTTLRFWFKLGLISFGGPAGQIAMMHDEIVVRKKWLSEESFKHALNYCMVLPGPEAQQLATYLGWLLHGTKGGVIAGVLFLLPSFFLLTALSYIYLSYGDQIWLSSIFEAIKPAVLAIILITAYRMGKKTIHSKLLALVMVLSLLAHMVFAIPFPLIIFISALVGYVYSRKSSALIVPENTSAQGHGMPDSAWHILLVIGLLWLIPVIALITLGGWQNPLTQMSWFFTKMAFVTFGGAYAVLPYIYQAAVEHFQWLTPTQMLDALALGESTPGPLIMIVAFVGYLGASAQDYWLGDSHLLMGSLGALVATWFTFLPSFLFILLGAPWVEKTKGQLKVQIPLQFISAAVIGMILQLAVFFGFHVLVTESFTLNISGLVIALASAVALGKAGWSILQVIGAAATVGLVTAWIA
jgi:chromate transporter